MNNYGEGGPVLFVGYDFDFAECRTTIEHSIITEATIEEALHRIQHDAVHGIVSEYQLQDGTGIDLVDAIRAEYPQLPFVLWTADGSEEIASRAITFGVTDYLIHGGEPEDTAIDPVIDRIEKPGRARSDNAVSQERKLFDRVFESCPTGITIVNENGEISHANDRAEEIFGVPEDEIANRIFDNATGEIIDWDGEPIPTDELPVRCVQRTGEAIYGKELGIRRSDGESTWLLVNSVPLVRSDDGSAGMSVVNAFEDVTDHRRTEEELNKIFDRVTDAVHGLDTEWRFTYLNDHAEELLGRTEAELRGSYVWDEFPDALERSYRERYERAMETQETIVFEEYSDAADAWLEVRVYPSDTGLSIYFRDISERKERERQLELFKRMVETVDDGVYATDGEGEFIFVNDSFVSMSQHSREELLGSYGEMFFGDCFVGTDEKEWRELVTGESDSISFETDIDGPNGVGRTVHNQFVNLQIDAEMGRVGVTRDITERKKRERKLERYETIIETIDDGVYAVDEDARFVLVNDAFCDLTGYKREEVLGQHATTNHDMEITPHAERLATEFVDGDQDSATIEFEIETKSGQRVPAESRVQPLSLENGFGRCGVVRDITERKQFEETLTALYHSANELLETETKDEVSSVVVDTITDILEIPGVVMYLYDDEADHLYPSAQSVEADFMREEFPAVSPDDSSITGHVYTTGEPHLFDDITDSPYLQTDATNMRSGVFVPIGTHGILVVGSPDVGTFDNRTQELIELLAATANAVYDRVAHLSQLQLSKERLSLALDAADAGVWEWNIETDEVTWDENLERLFGLEPGSFEGTYDGFVTRVHPDDRSDVEEALQQALERTGSFECEFRIIQDDGAEHWVSGQGIVVTEAEKPRRLLGIDIDITERKEHEEDLQFFRNLVDYSSDGINAVDPETADILEANEASCRMLGYDRSELLSQTVLDINPEFSMDMWDAFVESVKEEGQKVIESTHQRKDGSTFPVEIKITRAPLDSAYHVAAVRDITERKKREQELEASEEKFRSLIETAPDPIFVADAETGEIVETNTAACEIRKQSRDEIIGLHQSALHPEADAERYEALFEHHINQGGTINHFPDGSPVFLTTADGERIPVAISAQTVHLGDRTLIHGIFRDVSDQKQYENSLKELNRAAQDFLAAETDHEIAQTTVDIASDVLDLPSVAVYGYDEADGVLTPDAYLTATDDLLGELPTLSPGDSIAWRAYTAQEKVVVDDIRSADDGSYAGTPIRSELIIPLGEHGVFLAGDTEIGAFDELTVELVEVLTATAEAALERIDWARQLQEQERESQLHAQRLERVNQINEKIRSVIHAIVHAETRHEIEQAVCDALVEIDRFRFAWIGTPDFVEMELTPSSWAGTARGYLESISLNLESDGGDPSLTAAEQRETTAVSNIARSLQHESWRQDALLEDYRSVISIPILHDEVLYGVLTIYGSQPSTFDDLSATVLTDLGELIGYAITAVEQRISFRETGYVELTFELAKQEDLFTALVTRLTTPLEIRNITPRPDGSYLVSLLAQGVDPDRFREETRSLTAISEVRSIGDAERGRFELIISESSRVTDAAEFAPRFHSITISELEDRISIVIPQDRDVRSFIAHFREAYPDSTLVGRQDTERERSSLGPSSLREHLTTRQQEVLKAAYYGGFFDQPRKRTGAEVAESLGISQPAFSKQLRKSERNLLKTLYEPE